MRLLPLALVAFAACAPTLRKYDVIANGGGAAARGRCADWGLSPALELVPPGAPGCAQASDAFLLPEESTVALWQIGDSTLAGPSRANRIEVKVPLLVSGEGSRGLVAGEGQRGLEQGGGQKGLVSGEGERGLAQGENRKALSSGEGERGLTAGEGAKGLTSGGGARGLTSGEGERGLNTGADQRVLSSGESQRALTAGQEDRPVVTVEKSVDPDFVTTDSPVTFTLVVTNIGEAPLARLIVVDRLSKRLVATGNAAQQMRALPDQSTLILWDRPGPIAPHQTLTFRFEARVR